MYTCVAPINSSAWGFGISNAGRKIFIPRGKTIYFSLEVYPTIACTWNQDTNNQFASGTASSNNDNDVGRSSNSKSLEANKWQKCWFSYTAPADRDLIDANSNWGIVTTDLTTETTFYLRNIQAQIGDIPTAFQTPTLSIATASNTSSGTIYLLGVTNNTSGELQYNSNIYMNGSSGTITSAGFIGIFLGNNTSGGINFGGDHLLSSTARPTAHLHFGSDRLYHHTDANGYQQLWKSGDSVTGAVWNDYAEYRESDCQEFGRVLIENGDDSLSVSTKRLQPFAGVSSDTWGFCQGETEKAKTPIAVAGRVLAYPYQNRNNYKPGDCVCAAPNGTVDIMTRQEVIQYPDRIVGTVSCIPNYEEWGQGDRPAVKVDGRIWIKVR